jgi:integrase
MASMYKRDGVWYCKYFEKGKRRRVSLRTKSVARARAKVVEIEAALESGQSAGHRRDSDVDTFTKEYLKEIEATKRPHTVKTLAHEWKHFVAWAKPIKLTDVTLETLQAYKRHKLAKGYANSTVRSSLLAISSTFSTAIKDMHAMQGVNPVKGVGLPKPAHAFPRYLELTDIERLLSEAKAHSRNMHFLIALGIYSGMRKNELVNARWGWISFKGSGRVLVQASGRFVPKSGKGRKIPLSTKLRAILEEYKGDSDEFIVYPECPEKDGTSTKYRVDFTEAFSGVVKRAGLNWVTPHKMRHTFASQHAIGGVSIYKIKEWLGHADIKTTEVYAHLSPDDEDINTF